MNRLLTIACILLLACGCTRERGPEPEVGERVEVSFAVPQITVEAESADAGEDMQESSVPPATRAVTPENLTGNTTVRIVAFKAGSNPSAANYIKDQAYYVDKTGALAPCTVNADGSFAAADAKGRIMLIPGKYDFYAVTPALALDAAKTGVSVAQEVDFATSVTANVTIAKTSPNPSPVTLTMLSRQASRVIVEIKKAADNPATSIKIDPDTGDGSVVIRGFSASPRTCTIGGALAAAAGADANTLKLPASRFTIAADKTTSTATAYVLPKTTGTLSLAFDLEIISPLDTKKQTLTGTVSNVVFAAGTSYKFTLTVHRSYVTLKVDSWVSGGTIPTPVG